MFKGCLVKRAAVVSEMLVHEGAARVFNSDEDEIFCGRTVSGDVVIRYEGPKGSSEMSKMVNPASVIIGLSRNGPIFSNGYLVRSAKLVISGMGGVVLE